MKSSAIFSFRSLLVTFAGLTLGLSFAHAQATLPRAQVGVAYNYQVTTSTPPAAGTVYSATGLPSGLSINSSSGAVTGTPVAAGTATGAISLASGGVTNSFTYTLVVDPALGTPVITSPTTATATVGTAFAFTVTASNSPTSFNVGALPGGLTFTSPTIAGTPTTAGTFQIALSANNGTGIGAAVTLVLTISPAGPVPAINSATSASGPVGAAFTYNITASNAPVSYSAVGLPLGLSLNATTGAITGTPTIAGAYTVALSATNNNGVGATTNLALTIGALSSISNAAPLTVTVSQPMASFTLTATNSPQSYNVSGLPPGLAASAAGVITGTPTTLGSFTITASANNAVGPGPNATFTLTVAAATGGGGGGGGGGIGGGGGGGTIATAPIITTQPTSQSVIEGTAVSFLVNAAGTAPISYQWQRNGSALTGATLNTYAIPNVKAENAGAYAVVVSNTAGSTTSSIAALTVNALLTPPAITTQPVAQTGPIGGSATFTVVATGTTPISYQWLKDGTAVAGATSASLTLGNLATTSAGLYSVVITNATGTITSANAALTVTPAPAGAPVITTQPVAQTVAAGADVTLTVVATSTTAVTYQWIKDGVALAGATGATLTLGAAQPAAAGSYTVTVTNAAGSVTSVAATLVIVPPDSRLINLSTRGIVGAGERMLIAGFVIQGTEPKPVLIRAVGPTLGTLGVTGVVADPVLELFAGATSTTTNDNWGTAANATTIAATAARVGAFTLPATSADAVILTTLAPGNYTAQVRGAGASTGVGIVEIYDASEGPAPTKLINVATRGEVGTGGNILIAGFYVGGDQPKQVLIRAAGPGLTAFGVGNALADPRLQLFAGATMRSENDNWGTPIGAGSADAAQIAAASAHVGAFAFAAGSRDAVLLVTLPPGAYSAQVSGAGTTTGIALVEVYEVP